MIAIKNIYKKYNNNLVLNNVCFDIKRNIPLGLLGINGAGKTTLLMIIANLLKPDSGVVLFEEKPINKANTYLLLDGVRNFYWSVSVKENFYYYATLRGVKLRNIQNILEQERFLLLKNLWNKPFGYLSLGQKRMVAILFTQLINFKLMLLDEPSNGLDIDNQRRAIDLIKHSAQDKYMVVSSHDLDFLYKCCEEFAIIPDFRVSPLISSATKAR